VVIFRPRFLLVLSVCALFAAYAWTPLSNSQASNNSLPLTGTTGYVEVSPLTTQDPRNELTVQLNDSGFSPAEVQHAPGRFGIAVQNATSGEYRLKLLAADGTVLHEVQVQKGSAAWTVNLQTGTYTLTEANHPQWICRLIVQ
jgi:hypothetical protein